MLAAIQLQAATDARASWRPTEDGKTVRDRSYQPEKYPTRIPKWIWDDDGWQSVKDFHNARGEPRRWLAPRRSPGRELDIQPGDMVLIDSNLNGDADHIVLASSYDPATNTW